MFAAEAREHLQELSLADVRIQECPDDRETVDAIGRTPSVTATDTVGAIVERVPAGDVALRLDSNLVVEREDCSIPLPLVGDQGGAQRLPRRLGPG